MKVFLAFAFRPEDKDLVGYVDRLLGSLRIQSVTGDGLGGEQLTPAVQGRIDKCDALVALLTRRDLKQAGGFTTHQWVLDELGYARNQRKRVIAVIEDGIDVGGMYQSHEYISLDSANPLSALLRLSETMGVWQREVGRTVKVQILPSELAKRIGHPFVGVACSYRVWLQGRYSEWIDVTPVPEGGGTFVYAEGIQDEHLIQIQVKELDNARVWVSPATSQWMQVELDSEGRQ
jgi:hypothetical protein